MLIGKFNGYEFHVPISGGKAGTGFNKTSTIQVRSGNFIVKQFRFTMSDIQSRNSAIGKAKAFVTAQK